MNIKKKAEISQGIFEKFQFAKIISKLGISMS
jgi:hypothetical protein